MADIENPYRLNEHVARAKKSSFLTKCFSQSRRISVLFLIVLTSSMVFFIHQYISSNHGESSGKKSINLRSALHRPLKRNAGFEINQQPLLKELGSSETEAGDADSKLESIPINKVIIESNNLDEKKVKPVINAPHLSIQDLTAFKTKVFDAIIANSPTLHPIVNPTKEPTLQPTIQPTPKLSFLSNKPSPLSTKSVIENNVSKEAIDVVKKDSILNPPLTLSPSPLSLSHPSLSPVTSTLPPVQSSVASVPSKAPQIVSSIITPSDSDNNDNEKLSVSVTSNPPSASAPVTAAKSEPVTSNPPSASAPVTAVKPEASVKPAVNLKASSTAPSSSSNPSIVTTTQPVSPTPKPTSKPIITISAKNDNESGKSGGKLVVSGSEGAVSGSDPGTVSVNADVSVSTTGSGGKISGIQETQHELPSDLQSKSLLWLRAEDTVADAAARLTLASTGSVELKSWTSVTIPSSTSAAGAASAVNLFTFATQFPATAFNDLAQEIRKDSHRNSGKGAPLERVLGDGTVPVSGPKTVSFSFKSSEEREKSKTEVVSFPCSLTLTSSPIQPKRATSEGVAVIGKDSKATLKIHDQAPEGPSSEIGMTGTQQHPTATAISPLLDDSIGAITVFFILKPLWLGSGGHAPGQRFFGHFPSGQFRFFEKQASFSANGVDYLLGAQDDLSLPENELLLLTYRLRADKKTDDVLVEMSTQGRPLTLADSNGSRSVRGSGATISSLFSKDTPLVLGGVESSKCGFLGDIAEIILFKEALSDEEVKTTTSYLARKYGIDIPPATAVSKPKPKSSPEKSSVEGEGKADTGEKPQPPVDVSAIQSYIIAKDGLDGLDGLSPVEEAGVEDPQQQSSTLKRYDKLNPSKSDGKKLDKDVEKEVEDTKQLDMNHSNENLEVESLKLSLNQKSQPSESNNNNNNLEENVCSGHVDPFESEPLERFVPPRKATLKEVTDWKDEVNKMIKTISKMTVGGNKLREYMHEEVKRMKLLRFETFCKYIPSK